MQEGVASAVIALAEFLLSGACPPGALQQACGAATKLLKGEALCQDVNSDADEWEQEEEKEVPPPPSTLYLKASRFWMKTVNK
jgi:hypothetical protein